MAKIRQSYWLEPDEATKVEKQANKLQVSKSHIIRTAIKSI